MNNFSLKKIFDITSVRVKFIIITCTTLYLGILLNYVSSRFDSSDPIPAIESTMEKLKQARISTVRIRTGLFIKNIPVFDEIKNLFTLDAIVWFDFSPEEIMLETVEKFSFDNGKILYKSAPDIKLANGRVFVKYQVLCELKTDLRHYKFPFDDHRLSIVLSNDFVTPDEMQFLVDRSSFEIAPNIFVSNWRIYDSNVNFGFSYQVLDKVDKTSITAPKALFMINFAKASMRKTLIIFIPLFAAIFLSLFSFLMNIGNAFGKFSISASAVSALLGYRFVIETMMPTVGYFTTTDEIYLFLLALAFCCFIFQILLPRPLLVVLEKKDGKAKIEDIDDLKVMLEKINSGVFLVVVALLLTLVSYILLK